MWYVVHVVSVVPCVHECVHVMYSTQYTGVLVLEYHMSSSSSSLLLLLPVKLYYGYSG